jgi:hypothetical protein
MSLKEVRQQLLATAAHLEALAEAEERRAQEAGLRDTLGSRAALQPALNP